MNFIDLKTLVLFVFCFALIVGAGPFVYAKSKEKQYFYEEVTTESLSQLYWAVPKLNIDNDIHVDNFMMINECDIYKDYFHDEFEWRSVRESGRDFIRDNKESFPLRFQFMQSLKVREYDFERKGFDILEDFVVEGVRRFEVIAIDGREKVCGEIGRNIEGYPRALVVELSRPFEISFLPVEPDMAQEYIAMKMGIFKSLPKHQQSQRNLYETRNVYIVMKVKVFAYRGESRTREGLNLTDVMAVLEGYEIYADQEKTLLLHSESYRRRKKTSPMELELIKEYQAKKKKRKEAEAAKAAAQ